MTMLSYGITSIDNKPRAVVCTGFASIRKLVSDGHTLKFRAFHSSDTAKDYVMERLRRAESERKIKKLDEHRLTVLRARELEDLEKRKGLLK